MFSVVGEVFIDSETSVVTSSISRFASLNQFFEDVYRSRVCVRAFIEMSVRLCMQAFAFVTGRSRKKLTYMINT